MLIGEILSSLIMIFILILPGIFFRKKELISDHQSEAVSAIVVNLTWPCMVINAMQMEFSFQILKDSGYMMAVALIVFAILIAVSFPLARLLRMSKTKQYMAVFMLIFGNTGFLGIPVIKALYGTEAVFFAAILEMINDVLMFTIGIVPVSYTHLDVYKRQAVGCMADQGLGFGDYLRAIPFMFFPLVAVVVCLLVDVYKRQIPGGAGYL